MSAYLPPIDDYIILDTDLLEDEKSNIKKHKTRKEKIRFSQLPIINEIPKEKAYENETSKLNLIKNILKETKYDNGTKTLLRNKVHVCESDYDKNVRRLLHSTYLYKNDGTRKLRIKGSRREYVRDESELSSIKQDRASITSRSKRCTFKFWQKVINLNRCHLYEISGGGTRLPVIANYASCVPDGRCRRRDASCQAAGHAVTEVGVQQLVKQLVISSRLRELQDFYKPEEVRTFSCKSRM